MTKIPHYWIAHPNGPGQGVPVPALSSVLDTGIKNTVDTMENEQPAHDNRVTWPVYSTVGTCLFKIMKRNVIKCTINNMLYEIISGASQCHRTTLLDI